jgi:UDP-glucose 4-epimerase
MRVFITGGSGFIGSHLADRLLAAGHDIFVIDNYETGRRDNLTPHSNLTVVEGSICDEVLMASIFNDFKPEVVVHAAASYKDPENYIGDAKTNTYGSAVVAQNCKRRQVRRLIYLQTALCYGEPIEQPITLKHPIQPDGTSYAISKTGGELYVRVSGVDNVTFRLANAYGPRNISGPLPTFYSRLTTGKKCFVMDTRRDFVYVDDMIDILEKTVNGVGRSGAYHLSSGSDFSIKELFDYTLEALDMTLPEPVEVKPRGHDDAATILLDPSETLRDFGQIPNFSLKEGIRRTIGYYKEYGIAQTYTHLKIEKHVEATQ